jgi:hypothetical protein
LARMRRFLRPCFRRPLPDFLVPNADSKCDEIDALQTARCGHCKIRFYR